ncbi:MAG: hypothetical protein V7629_21465, partial [Motiliproteus sp.]
QMIASSSLWAHQLAVDLAWLMAAYATEQPPLLTLPLLQFMQHFHEVLAANIPYDISSRGSCGSISGVMYYCCIDFADIPS